MKKKWSEEEDKKLIEVYFIKSDKELEECFPGRPLGGIILRASRLGLTAAKRKKFLGIRYVRAWKKEEDDILIRYCSQLCITRIKELYLPHKSLQSIRVRRRKLNLSSFRLKRGEYKAMSPEEQKKRAFFLNAERRKNQQQALFDGIQARSKRLNIPFNIEVEDIVIPDKCPIFGIPLYKVGKKPTDNSPSVDRIIPELGYVKGNILVMSMKANRLKNNATLEELKILAENLIKVISSREKGFVSVEQNCDKKKKILVIGDSCQDFWIRGTCRLNPEAPSLAFKAKSEIKNGGMAENVCSNLKTLDKCCDILFITNTSQIYKKRYVDEKSGNILFRVDENDELKEGFSLNFLDKKIKENGCNYSSFDAVVISDYNKGYISENNIRDIIQTFSGKSPVFIDTKKNFSDKFLGAFLIKINQLEYQENFRKFPNLSKTNLIVTLGAGGSIWMNKNLKMECPKVELPNVCGCGDSYLSGFVIHYLDSGGDFINSMKYATACASFVATKKAVYSPTKEEVLSFCDFESLSIVDDKIE